MMPSTSKSARSRFSSPLHLSSSPSSHNKGATTDGQRKFLQRWLEPPVQNKASFQEAGLVRTGVVENMVPLGTLPRQAKKHTPVGGEATPAPGPAVKKIVLKKSTAASAAPVEEGTQQPVATIESPGRQSSSPTRPVFPINGLDDEDDDDYMPVPKKSTKGRRSSAGPGANAGSRRGSATRPVRVGRRSTAAVQKSSSPSPFTQPSTTETGLHSSVSTQPAPPSQSERSSFQTPQPHQALREPEPVAESEPDSIGMPTFKAPVSVQREPENKELVDKIVEVAVEEALRYFRYPTAYALRNLYDENHANPHFVSMFEDVFHQRADIDALTEFNRLITARKRDGKLEDKGFHYWVPPPTNTQHFTPQKPRPAPYTALLTMDITPAKNKRQSVDYDQHVHKKLKLEDQQNVAMYTVPPMVPAAAPATVVTTSTTPTPTPAPAAASEPVEAADPADVRSSAAVAVNGANGTTNGTHGGSAISGINGLKVHKSPQKSPHKSPGKGRRRRRSRSVSSDSSLSSVPDDALANFDDFMDQVDEELGVSRPSTAEPNDAPTPASSSQPISARQKRPASKKKIQCPELDLSPDIATTHHPSPSQDLDMPAAIAVHGASHQHTPKKSSGPNKSTVRSVEPDDPRHLIDKKVIARQGTQLLTKETVAASFSRKPLASDPFEDGLPRLAPLEQPRAVRTPAPPLTLRAARAAKRHHENADEAISPTTAARADHEPPSSARSSRAATPSNVRSTKKQRIGLRVKTSPMKKKGTSAGIPRGSGERPSPVFNGPPHEKDENDDSCFTCGGSGELVCCDGCSYSFHFLCIDPPMDETLMPDEWYCNECMHKFFPEKFTGHRGAFGTLLDALDKRNPRAFRLPLDIRECFEGVKTGPDGEYEETTSTKPKPNKKGYEEAFDFFRVRNTDGNAVLCHQCHQGVTASRPIIPCSICGLNWHLDCLDPPLAVPPVLRNWRCPCHVEDAFMANLAPAHKYRKIKNAPVIEQAYSRGMRNNGWIEIEEDDDDEQLEGTWAATRRDFGRVYRLPERGIKLDFLSRVHENRAKERAPGAQSRSSNPALSLASRTIEEQQAALNLSQLAGSGNGVSQLVSALIANAPPAAVSLMASGDATHLGSGNITQLDANSISAMLAQVEQLKTTLTKLLDSKAIAAAQEILPQSSQGDDTTMRMD
ncbi:hypothetical protein SCAR479_01765 [Seiridium cardinale]|uniref:PHD-type domain-containing protein n=1 Tax=Seiridium cardinale TaxID=138064 RepID=A0ABR2Y761_9PEZI